MLLKFARSIQGILFSLVNKLAIESRLHAETNNLPAITNGARDCDSVLSSVLKILFTSVNELTIEFRQHAGTTDVCVVILDALC